MAVGILMSYKGELLSAKLGRHCTGHTSAKHYHHCETILWQDTRHGLHEGLSNGAYLLTSNSGT